MTKQKLAFDPNADDAFVNKLPYPVNSPDGIEYALEIATVAPDRARLKCLPDGEAPWGVIWVDHHPTSEAIFLWAIDGLQIVLVHVPPPTSDTEPLPKGIHRIAGNALVQHLRKFHPTSLGSFAVN